MKDVDRWKRVAQDATVGENNPLLPRPVDLNNDPDEADKRNKRQEGADSDPSDRDSGSHIMTPVVDLVFPC